MAFQLNLPPPWPKQGWKVKIRDRERVEPPHVTILRKTQAWRFGLREQTFLDGDPDPAMVPEQLVEEVRRELTRLQQAWDALYPDNPVRSRASGLADAEGPGDDHE